ncbi:MAG: glycoside hydrolase family 127 protein [Anaerolineaceae bacterium]|nr:glycoside hydrolase family 127 protein [Anaerolineaceae bacterium]
MIKAKPFSLKQVNLFDGPFKDAMVRDAAYLMQLDPDRLLHMFRMTAGLSSDAEPYGGWESPEGELRGHSLGHYLSACSLMYASTSDEAFKERADYIVAVLGECQDAMPTQGYNQGFLSAYPETFFDRVDRRWYVWAPYYTLHKILAGLLDAYNLCNDDQALVILENMADWLYQRTSRLTQEQMKISLLNEPGGITETLASLYGVTGKPEHLTLLQRFNDEVLLGMMAREEDHLDRMHANTQVPKAIGAALQYEVAHDEASRKIATFFWERVALARSYAIGGHSDDELFFPVDRFGQHLSTLSAETCNTYNMLKLTRHLFGWEPSATYMDFYERGLFNHILGSQDPEAGMVTYFISHRPGHVKLYNTPENSFWCCVGTGIENHAKYGDTIYYHDDDSLYVNLFIASELIWPERGITLRQETTFPDEDTTRLLFTCHKPTSLALKIRYPYWAEGMTLTVNGEAVAVDGEPGSYVTIEREWQDGDEVIIKLPMSLRLEALPGEPDIVAFMYGPIVLVGALGTDDEMPGPYLNDYHVREAAANFLPTPDVPVLKGSKADLLTKTHAVEGKLLTFVTEGIGQPHDVELVPFYVLHHQRYTIYWQRVD